MSYRREVGADLMPTRPIGAYFHSTSLSCRLAREQFAQRGFGIESSYLTRIDADPDFASVAWIVRDRQVDALWRRYRTDASCQISLLDRACAQGISENLKRRLIARREHQPRGPVVEPMENAGLSVAIADAPHFGIEADQCASESSELAGPERVAWHIDRFVDHDVAGRLQPHLDRSRRIWGRVKIGGLGKTLRRLDLDAVTDRHHGALSDAIAVEPHLPGVEQLLCAAPTHPLKPLRQHRIETLPSFLLTDFETDLGHGRSLPHFLMSFHTVCAAVRPVYTGAQVTKRDYYVVLEVTRTASGDDIKQAYRQLAMRFHPDRNPDDPSAEDAFKEATEAYTVLSDPSKRGRYDRYGHSAFESNGSGFEASDFGAVSEILEGILGDVFSGGRRKRRAGRDLQYDMEISFTEAALGVEKEIDVNRPTACDTCGGTGGKPGTPVHKCNVCQGRGQVKYQRGLFAASRPCHGCRGTGKKIPSPCEECDGLGTRPRSEKMTVKIPSGVQNGAVRTVRGAGETGEGGNGDLHIHIKVDDHDLFTREGADILVTIPISFPQAVLGASIDIPTLEGKVVMKVPPGTPSGKVFRLRGKGIPVYGGYGKGDQLVTVIVEVPREVNRKQRRLIVELGQEIGLEGHPEQASFLGKLRSLFDS